MNRYILKIDGMRCSMCEIHVNDLIRKNFNVVKVKSSHTKNEVIFLVEDELSEEKIKEAFAPSGYKVLKIDVEHNAKRKLFGI